MKTRYLMLISLALSASTRAQDWQCVQPGAKPYFVNGEGYLRGMRIDSVRTSGPATIYYPYHTARGPYIVSGGGTPPMDTNGGSWMGGRIIALPGGKTCFFNSDNDTLVVETLAAPGASWVFYHDTSAVFYTASVTSAGVMMIDGQPDSIRRISLQANNAQGPVANDIISQYGLILSREHGLIRAFDFYNFPYAHWRSGAQRGFDFFFERAGNGRLDTVANLFDRVAFKNPQNEDLYRYEAGDTYQFSLDQYNVPGTRKVHIDAKRDYPDRTEYDESITTITGYPYPPGGLSVYHSRNTEMIYKQTAYIVDTVRMPEEYGVGQTYRYFPADSSHCLRSPRYLVSGGDLFNGFEPCGYSLAYKTGRGRIADTRCMDPTPNHTIYEVLNYVADTMGHVCGQLNTLATGQVTAPNKVVTIYPDPASSELHIRYGYAVPDGTATIYDMTGRLVYRTSLSEAVTTVPTSSWPAGLYLLRCRLGEAIDVRPFRVGR